MHFELILLQKFENGGKGMVQLFFKMQRPHIFPNTHFVKTAYLPTWLQTYLTAVEIKINLCFEIHNKVLSRVEWTESGLNF